MKDFLFFTLVLKTIFHCILYHQLNNEKKEYTGLALNIIFMFFKEVSNAHHVLSIYLIKIEKHSKLVKNFPTSNFLTANTQLYCNTGKSSSFLQR